MKRYLIIVLLVGVGLGENLTFINSKDTIVFKYKDLININQERFRFLNKDGDIINLTKEYMFKSMESKSDIVKMNVNEIKSFQSYERFRLSNAMDKSKFNNISFSLDAKLILGHPTLLSLPDLSKIIFSSPYL